MKKFHPMSLLLKFEGYPPAVIASVALHVCLLIFILGRSVDPADYVTVEDPVIITATAIEVNPQRLRRIERIEEERLAERQRQERITRENREREARERETRERQEAERRRQDEIARQRAADEAERQRLAEESRRRAAAEEETRRQEQQRQAREQAEREAALRAAQQAQANSQVASENLIVAEYSARIRQIITQSWQIPPSARNGMSAQVRLQLVPTGEVVGVVLVRGSGDAVFDRSVMQAVERAGSFPELQDLENAVFERNFRTFDLLFRPEDLLR